MAYVENTAGTRKYDDLYEMLRDMREHHEQTKEALRIDDDPWQRCIGYAADTRAWRLDLSKLRTSIDGPPQAWEPERVEIFRRTLQTVEGRESLARSIMQGDSVV